MLNVEFNAPQSALARQLSRSGPGVSFNTQHSTFNIQHSPLTFSEVRNA
jgi:hypothetical protein